MIPGAESGTALVHHPSEIFTRGNATRLVGKFPPDILPVGHIAAKQIENANEGVRLQMVKIYTYITY